LFLELKQQGMTLIVSSHILAELEAYSSDMLIIREGKIVEQVAIAQHNTQRKAFKLALSAPVLNLAEILANISFLSSISASTQQATFQLKGDEQQQYLLLKTLLEQNLQVCELSPIVTNFQDVYLSTLKS
jgi:ABC-2 type transport system ATP-binding protein